MPGRSALSLSHNRWLAVARPHLSDVLVAPPALEQLSALAYRLPGDWSSILEIRLAPGAQAVDLSVRLPDPSQAGRLTKRISHPRLDAVLSRWSRDDGDLAAVRSLWLEFDLDQEDRLPETGALPLPSLICAKLYRAFEPDWLIDTLLPALRGSPLPAVQRVLVRRCFDQIPPAGRLLYAFGLLSRPGEDVRLELYGLDPAAMADYLGRVGASEAYDRVTRLTPLFDGVERFHLSLDIGAAIAPRIGIECGFRRQPRREPRWLELVDRLVAHGLCTPEKRDAVFNWPGVDSLRTAARRWPADAVALGGYCVRCLSHVKLVSWPDREPEAKVYLLFEHLKPTSGAGVGGCLRT